MTIVTNANDARQHALEVPTGREYQEEQKREELFYVSYMLHKMGVLIQNRLDPIWDEPAPDFKLEYGGQWVSLEVTEAHPKDDDGNPLYFRAIREEAISLAWKNHQARGGRPLLVHFQFKEGSPASGPLTKKDVPFLASQLLYLVAVGGFDSEGPLHSIQRRKNVPDV